MSLPSYASHSREFQRRREQEVEQTVQAARAEGLADCKKETAFFKTLGIGEARTTSYMKVGGSVKSKVQEQWWAPAPLVELNVIMRKQGLGSKVRARCIKLYQEGKDLPPNAQRAIAIHTERILCQ
jgi:hypothetical protein